MNASDLNLYDVLPNGATLLRKRVRPDGSYVVMCEFDGKYVTWVMNAECSTYWGHYFNNDVDANVDFRTR